MKHCHQIIAAIVLATSAGAVPAQDYDPERLEAMSKLEFLEGRWTGETWTRSRDRGEYTGRVVEIVETKLNGSILTLEGLGASGDPEAPGVKLEHHAFAVIHYDTESDRYRMHSYKNGKFLDADLSVTGKHAVEWGFDVNNGGRMRFRINLDDSGRWTETGAYSPDGEAWHKYFEMTLERDGE